MKRRAKPPITSLAFFARLQWLDGRPLLDTLEPYRRAFFAQALDSRRDDGVPTYNFVLSGRAKKNWKSTDLTLAALYCLLIRDSASGNDGFILANDEQQAGDDLEIAKKLIAINPALAAELAVLTKEIRRHDGRGALKILPARDVVGAHGKTYGFCGFDEIHGYKSYDLFESLAPDPTRADALTWVTSYDTIFSTAGIPLFDFKATGKAGTDPRMLFSWYSGMLCTDPEFAELEPELRANPSLNSWPEGRGYIEQQRRRLPTHKFRRLHLNLPGAPNGAFFDQGRVMSVVAAGRIVLPYEQGRLYFAFVDMSGGSRDDAVLCIAHEEDGRVVIDRVEQQAGEPPFNARMAVVKFAGLLREYHLSSVMGDAYAGLTYKQDFESLGITYQLCPWSKSELYGALEPVINAGEIELPDIPKLIEQLLTLVTRGAKVDHEPGGHDDWANAAAGAVWRIRRSIMMDVKIVMPFVAAGMRRNVPGGVVGGGAFISAPTIGAISPHPTTPPLPAAPAAAATGQHSNQPPLPHKDAPIPSNYLKQPAEPWSAYVGESGISTQRRGGPPGGPPRGW